MPPIAIQPSLAVRDAFLHCTIRVEMVSKSRDASYMWRKASTFPCHFCFVNERNDSGNARCRREKPSQSGLSDSERLRSSLQQPQQLQQTAVRSPAAAESESGMQKVAAGQQMLSDKRPGKRQRQALKEEVFGKSMLAKESRGRAGICIIQEIKAPVIEGITKERISKSLQHHPWPAKM